MYLKILFFSSSIRLLGSDWFLLFVSVNKKAPKDTRHYPPFTNKIVLVVCPFSTVNLAKRETTNAAVRNASIMREEAMFKVFGNVHPQM